MANYIAQYHQPWLIDYERLGTNGSQVNAPMMQRIANGFNHISGHRRKVLALIPFNPKSPFKFSTGTEASPESAMSGRFHTGPSTRSIRIRVGMAALNDDIVTDMEPAVWVRFNGSTNTDKIYHSSWGGASAAQPNRVFHALQTYTCTANTTYTWVVQGQDKARLVYFCMYEDTATVLPATDIAVVNPAVFVPEGPILAEQALQLVNANNNVLRKAGAHLLQHNNADEPTTTSASYGTIFVDENAYCTLDLANKDTRNRDVDILFAADGAMTSAGSGAVELHDGSSQLAEITGFTSTRAWRTSQTTLTATADKSVKVRIKADGTNTFTLYGYSLYIYDP